MEVTKLAGPKPTEYSAGQPLERYSAERRRRGIATESAAYGGAAGGVTMAGGMLGNAKIAGTKIGQHVLTQGENRLKATNHPAAAQVSRLKRIGATAARHPHKMTAGIAATTAAAGGLGVLSRMRANEEAGISQGVGRIKAGEAYRDTQRRALSKGLVRTALMASDTDLNDPRLLKTLKFANRHAGKIALGTVGTAGGAGLVASGRAGQNRLRQTRELRRVSQVGSSQLAKSAGGADFVRRMKVKEHFGTPGAAVRTIGRNPQHIAAGAVLGGGAAIQHPKIKSQRSAKQRQGINATTGAAGGAVAGHLGWMGHTQRVRTKGHALERVVPEGMSRNQRDKIMSAHRKEHGIAHGANPNRQQAKGYFRTYPESMPAAPLKRKLGRIATGATGLKNQGLAIAVPATALAMAGSVSTRGKKEHVGKALYQHEERLSPLRLAQLGAGVGLGAWGLGRSRMVGAALSRGIRMATTNQNHNALRALQYAQAAQGALARGTVRGERAVRQVRAVDTAVRAVPAGIRPDIALASGLLLVGRGSPPTTSHYKPVSSPIRVRPMGW